MEEKEIMERRESNNKAYIEFLSDVLDDRRKDSRFFKGIIIGLVSVIIVLVCGLVVISIHCQNRIESQADRSEQRMYEFLKEYDFHSSIDLDTGVITGSDTSGNISFNQRR